MSKDYGEWAGPNSNVVSQIEDYCYGESNIPFALMLRGKWGSGKTYLVRRFFRDKHKEEVSSGQFPKPLHVSLYGIRSTEEISYALYAALHPVLESKGGRLLRSIGKGLLKNAIKIDLSEFDKISEQISLGSKDFSYEKKSDTHKSYKRRPIIFDDVERAKLPISDVLSFIQPLVETGENRVLVIANEEEIARNDEDERQRYELIKEKTIHLTLEVQPYIKAAWEEALETLCDGGFKEFLTRQEEDFTAFLTKITEHNLRLLSFFMCFGNKLYNIIDSRYKCGKYDEGLLKVFRTLYALLIERRVHGVSVVLIKLAVFSHGSNIDTDKERGQRRIYDRIRNEVYCDDILAPIISLSILSPLLERGEVVDDVNGDLSRSFFFSGSQKDPSWKRLREFRWLSEEEIKKVVESFRQDFNGRKFHYDDTLYVCDVYLMLCRFDIKGFERENAQSILKQYIDESLKKDDSIGEKYHLLHECNDDIVKTFQGGLEYLEKGDKIFNCLHKYYNNKISENIYKEIEKEISEIDDIIDFFLKEHNSGEGSKWIGVPFLWAVDHNKIIDELLMKGDDKVTFLFWLKRRFNEVSVPQNILHKEYKWFQEFVTMLEQKIESLDAHPLCKEGWRVWIKNFKDDIGEKDSNFFNKET